MKANQRKNSPSTSGRVLSTKPAKRKDEATKSVVKPNAKPGEISTASRSSSKRGRPGCDRDRNDAVQFRANELLEGQTYVGRVVDSYKLADKDRYKLVIQESESGDNYTFTEPFPFDGRYSAVGQLFFNNGVMLEKLSDLEGLQVEFSVYINEPDTGKVYVNIDEIAFVDVDDEDDENSDDDLEEDEPDTEEEEEDDDDIDRYFNNEDDD